VRSAVFSIVFAILAAFVEAPFQHLHPNDPSHRHRSGLAHWHAGHPHPGDCDAPHFEETESAIWLDWIASIEDRHDDTPAVFETLTRAWMAATEGTAAAETATNIHSPPLIGPFPPRAPPA